MVTRRRRRMTRQAVASSSVTNAHQRLVYRCYVDNVIPLEKQQVVTAPLDSGIPTKTWDDFAHAVAEVVHMGAEVLYAALPRVEICARLAIPSHISPHISPQLARVSHSMWRLDCLVVDGHPICIEANMDSGLGGLYYWQRLTEMYSELGDANQVGPLDVLGKWLGSLGGPIGYMNYRRDDGQIASEDQAIVRHLQGAGVDVRPLDDFHTPNREVRHVFRAFMAASGARDASRPDTPYRWSRLGVNLYSGAESFIHGNKLLIADLLDTQYRAELGESLQQKARQLFPETRRLSRSLNREELLRDRSRLVLKRGLSHASRDVFLGPETEQAAWEQAVDAAADDGGWVVQRYVHSDSWPIATIGAPHDRVQCRVLFTPMSINGTFAVAAAALPVAAGSVISGRTIGGLVRCP